MNDLFKVEVYQSSQAFADEDQKSFFVSAVDKRQAVGIALSLDDVIDFDYEVIICQKVCNMADINTI